MNTETKNIAIRKAVGNDQSAALMAVQEILKVATPTKVMSKFNRNVNDNIKLDRFLNNEVVLPKAFNPEKIEEVIQKLIEPKKYEHKGLSNVDQQKVLLTALEQGLLDVELASKTVWLQTFKLDEDQEQLAATAMTRYEKTLRSAIVKGTAAWRKVYGENQEL